MQVANWSQAVREQKEDHVEQAASQFRDQPELIIKVKVFSMCMAKQSLTEDLPAEKQTKLGLYVSAVDACQKWKAAPESVKILDVRTPEEYIYVGHAVAAVNIPLLFQAYRWNDEKGFFDFDFNPMFLNHVKDWAEPSDTLMLICRSGGRSAMAVNLLADAGYTQAWNVIDGMEGDVVQEAGNLYAGKRMKNGWKNSGLEWTCDVNPTQLRLPVQNQSGQRGRVDE